MTEPRTKLIGVLGGTSWPSTMLPYRYLNEAANRRLGGHHSARILLYSLDYHAIKSRYASRWNEVPELLRAEIEELLRRAPDCWMLANDTLHKAYDEIEGRLPGAPPFFHAVRLVRDEIVSRSLTCVLLLGTKFTMEDGFYAAPLEAAGVEVRTPDLADRDAVQAIQTRLAAGETDPAFGPWFANLIARHAAGGCQAVVLACTELPLAIDPSTSAAPVVDPLRLQCEACVGYALAGFAA